MPRLEGVDKYVACGTCAHVRAHRNGAAPPVYSCPLGLGRPRCVVRRRGKRPHPGAKPWRTNIYWCPRYEGAKQ